MGQALSSCTPCFFRSAQDKDVIDVDDEAKSRDEEENSNGSDSEGSIESNDVSQLQKSDEEPRKTCQPLFFHACLKYLSERAENGQRSRNKA